MNKLKTILLSNSSKYSHLVILATLFLFVFTYSWLLILIIVYLIYLSKKANNLFLLALILLIVLFLRINFLEDRKKETLPLEAEVYEIYDDYIIIKSKHKYLVYLEDNKDLKPGSIIKVSGIYYNYDSYNIVHNFDYNRYLQSKNIIGIIDAENISKIDETFNIRIIRYKIAKYLDNNFKLTSSYLKMFVIGNKTDIDSDVIEKSNKIGISHLFAISGMHLALIVGFLNKFMQLFYLRRKTYNLIIYLFISLYIIITGFSIPIIRSGFLMAAIIYVKKNNLVLTRSDVMAFSYLVFVIINPNIIFNIGFQFSYIIAYSILFSSSFINNNEKIKQIFQLGFIATLFGLPIFLEMNKEFGLLNIFVNVIFVIIVGYILLPGAFLVIIFPKFNYIYTDIIKYFEILLKDIENINVYISFNIINPFFKLGYWILLVLTIMRLKTEKQYRYVSILLCFILIIGNFSYIPKISFVRILDVNQGDAIHLHNYGCNMLIDTGNSDEYNHLINYFLGSNIRELDNVVLTHKHIDHYGEINDIISKIKVKKIYVNNYFPEIPIDKQIILEVGDTIHCNNIELLVLNGDNQLSNENNNSLVLYGKIGNESWLFSGDIEADIETKLINNYNIKVDQLKLSHHGSFSSNTEEFLKKIKPKNAYISVGENAYGLPDERVINRLKNLDVDIHITKESGTITIYYFNNWQYTEYYYESKKHFRI